MDVVAQWVRTSWTKRSRGGPAATRRNAAPVGFSLPTLRFPAVHEITIQEWYDFAPRDTVRDGAPEGVGLTEQDGCLRVELTDLPVGRPHRWWRPRPILLAPGEWLRWQLNYRTTTMHSGDWIYHLRTLNLAYGPVPPHVFTGRPTRTVDERTWVG